MAMAMPTPKQILNFIKTFYYLPIKLDKENPMSYVTSKTQTRLTTK